MALDTAVAVGKAVDAVVGKALDTAADTVWRKLLQEVAQQKDILGWDIFAPDPRDAQADMDRNTELLHALRDAVVHSADVEEEGCKNAHCKTGAMSVLSTSKISSTLLSDQQPVRGDSMGPTLVSPAAQVCDTAVSGTEERPSALHGQEDIHHGGHRAYHPGDFP